MLPVGQIPWNKGNTSDPVKRFWSHVEKTDSCWNWTACIAKNGYGRFVFNTKHMLVHRISYELIHGKIPEGKQLDHLCRNRRCVNPVHLQPVPPKENVLRGIGITAKNSEKTHCKRGHELSGENLVIEKNGSRQCRLCKNAKNSKFMNQWYQNHRDQMKQYRDKNRESRKETMKKWREKNREKIKEYKKQYKLRTAS